MLEMEETAWIGFLFSLTMPDSTLRVTTASINDQRLMIFVLHSSFSD
jgi:hypothetical protein